MIERTIGVLLVLAAQFGLWKLARRSSTSRYRSLWLAAGAVLLVVLMWQAPWVRN